MGSIFSSLKQCAQVYTWQHPATTNSSQTRVPLPLPSRRTMSKEEVQSHRKKYSFIADNFTSLDQVTAALREAGLESSNLIVGIDFTKSNEWTGPTSYGPVVEAAVDIVERSGGQFHVLIIIADGQVTKSVNTRDGELSLQEERTIQSIVTASSYPLSIILVGVGDGPWDDMKKFDDKIPARDFHNFQFVNFTGIMSRSGTQSEKEASFALAALMEIPFQYKAVMELCILGRVMGKAKRVNPRPPPLPHHPHATLTREPSNPTATTVDDQNQACPICLTNRKDMAFGCGHMTCRECGPRVRNCPICRQPISSRIRLYT
ncbi:hypothetical protein CRG98_016776 [Punica granatum]|uniref:RING-type domain-containing protein n=1 Tax=Punica granatum TaxID=22663 RepID=A0A2I0K2P6_PUNGR|nr:hypothetical protein CRG98_016776 [Punica granatum]